jgi:hypothetical protein
MACLYFFGSATSVCRYDYGNSELNFAISWLRGLAKIVKSQVLRRYQMRIKGLRSRAAPRNLARPFSQRTPICSDRVSTLSDSNLQTTRSADPRPQMFEIDPTCSIRKNEARKTAPGDRWREQRFGDAPIAAELVRPRIIKDRTARAWLRAHSGRQNGLPRSTAARSLRQNSSSWSRSSAPNSVSDFSGFTATASAARVPGPRLGKGSAPRKRPPHNA